MNHIENYTAIAAALGGTFIPCKWREYETASEDRGYIVFGDPADWRTPRLFLHPPWNTKTYGVSAVSRLDITLPNGLTRQHSDYKKPISTTSISVGRERDPVAAAKDIKRRLLDPMLKEHPAAVAAVEAQMAKDNDTEAWKTKMGFSNPKRDTERVWMPQVSFSGPRADLRVGYENEITISNLSRPQAEKVLQFLKREMS